MVGKSFLILIVLLSFREIIGEAKNVSELLCTRLEFKKLKILLKTVSC